MVAKFVEDQRIFLFAGRPSRRVAALVAGGVLAVLLSLLLSGCASQGLPGGGPKDVAPPVPQQATPPNGSTSFAGRSFYIEFDEYVTIKDAESNVIVSPPMRHKPQYVTKGRGVEVKLRDTLLPGTTYLFQFEGAVADFNEGNVLPAMEYVFSTGKLIDTFSLGGRVIDAYNGHPWAEPVTAALYAARPGERRSPLQGEEQPPASLLAAVSAGDSLIVKERPDYVTRCDSTGAFAFHYLRPGAYWLRAFADADKNLKWGGGEAVAFCDTLVHAVYLPLPAPTDTAMSDSAARVADSLRTARKASLLSHTLFLSAPVTTVQRLADPTMPCRGQAVVPAVLPMHAPQVRSLADSIVWRANGRGDTLRVWALNEHLDNLWLTVQDATGINDTLKLRYRAGKGHGASAGHSGPSAAASPAAALRQPYFAAFSAAGRMHYYDTLWLSFQNPVVAMLALQDTTAPQLSYIYNVSDSLPLPCSLYLDSSGLRAMVADSGGLPLRFEPGKQYRCLLPPHLFMDIYGHANDTVACDFALSTPADYGNLSVEVDAAQWQLPAKATNREVAARPLRFVIQLLDDKEHVVRQQVADTACRVLFAHLQPGSYTVRAIEDCNGNASWDAGDYWQHRQPERTFAYGKTIVLRANWDINEQWRIGN